MPKSNFDLVDGKYVGCCIAVQNFRKFCSSLSRAKRRANIDFRICSKICFVQVQFMCLPNLHTTLKEHLIKIGTFFRKTILIEKNIRSHDVLNGLNSIKFLEIVKYFLLTNSKLLLSI